MAETFPPLNYDTVSEAIIASLSRDKTLDPKNLPPNIVVVTGIVRSFGFDRDALETQRPLVVHWITNNIPRAFLIARHNPEATPDSAGASFMELPFTRGVSADDPLTQTWGEQRSAEELLVLAMGLGLARVPIPRSHWGMLPGSMPYLEFSPDGFTDADMTPLMKVGALIEAAAGGAPVDA